MMKEKLQVVATHLLAPKTEGGTSSLLGDSADEEGEQEGKADDLVLN